MLDNYVVFKVTDVTPEYLIDKLVEISKKYDGVNAEWDAKMRLLSFKDFSMFQGKCEYMIRYIASLRNWVDVSKPMQEYKKYKLELLINSLKCLKDK